MGARGPQPTPAQAKQLASDPGRQASNVDEPVPVPGAPEMPPYLTGLAAETWDKVCAELSTLGILATCDEVLISSYCVANEQFWENYADLKKYGRLLVSTKTDKWGRETKTMYANPCVNLHSMFFKERLACCAPLGLGPAWRAGVSKLPQAETKGGLSQYFSKNLKVVG